MKTIILTRHAKSSWNTDSATDFERPLNKRGFDDAPVMAKRLLEHGPLPQLVISSTAKRAHQTAELLMRELALDQKLLTTTESIYEVPARDLINQMKQLPADADIAMIIGHNPAMSSACSYLSKDADMQMSTLAMVCMELDVEDWEDIYPDCGTLRWYDYPKKHTGKP